MVGHSPFILKLEEDLKPVLAAIEKRGLIVDTKKMWSIISGLLEEKNQAGSKAYDLLKTSRRVNLNSSAEVAELLEELKIEGWELTSTNSGVTAAKDVLEKIEHPAIQYVIKYRSLTRLISCLESYLEAVNMIDPRLYYKFTNECPSGRLYTKDMPVQTLPHVYICVSVEKLRPVENC